MTRKEKALLNPDVRIDAHGDFEIKYNDRYWPARCPSCINDEWEDVDEWTMKLDDKWEYTIGCRGITCKECWNKNVDDITLPKRLNISDKEHIKFCIQILEQITSLGRDKPLGDLYPISLTALGGLRRVLEPNGK